nr:hypothetical protein [Tanacetum cinerariifolium]
MREDPLWDERNVSTSSCSPLHGPFLEHLNIVPNVFSIGVMIDEGIDVFCVNSFSSLKLVLAVLTYFSSTNWSIVFRNFNLEETNKKNSLLNKKRWNYKLHKPVPLQSYPSLSRVIIRSEGLAQTTTNDVGTSTILIPGPVTTEEKAQKKNDVKEEVKGTASSSLSSSSSSQNMAFLSYPSITNEVNTAYGVSTANTQVIPDSTQVSTASTQVSTANLSDPLYDKEEMDLKWQLALLSMRTRRFFQKTSRKITINGNDTAGYEKSKVGCFNYHQLGHFVRECRQPRNQDSRNKNQDSCRRTVNVEYTSSNAMVAIDGVGFDWSYMADDEVSTNMALMAFLDFEVHLQKVKEDQEYVDSGYFRHMTWNMSYHSYFKEFNRVYVSFRGGANGGRITGKGTIKTDNLNFEDVYFVKELKFNLFCVSQMCDRKNNVLFTDIECLVLSPNFKLLDESQILLRVPRKNNMYSIDMKNIVPKESLTCLDDTTGILKKIITEIENLVDKKVGIRREFSVARTPQQNGVVERRNRTQIKVVKTMLADSKLPITFWAEAVNTACYVYNKEITCSCFHGFIDKDLINLVIPDIRRCYVTILNTLDPLGKFDRKSDEGFFVGYLLNSKAFRVYNIRTRKVEENLHIRFLEDKPTIAGNGPKWLFDIDVLTKSINYVPVIVGTNSNDFVGTEKSIGKGHSSKEKGTLWKDGSLFDSSSKNASNVEPQPSSDAGKKDDEGVSIKRGIDAQERPENSINDVNMVGLSINIASTTVNTGSLNINIVGPSINTANTNINTGILNINTVVSTNLNPSWIEAMQEELLQFKLKKVWTLVDLPNGKTAIRPNGFLEDKPSIAGNGPKWLFDIDVLTKSINYVPVVVGTNSNDFVGTEKSIANHADFLGDETEVDMSNITTTYQVPSTPNTRIHKDHSLDHVISDVQSGVQTRRVIKTTNKQGFISVVYEGKSHENLNTCLFACFLSQIEPTRVVKALYDPAWMDVKSNFLYGRTEEEVYVCQPPRIVKALSDPAWVEAMQEELLQFKLQKVWILVDLLKGKKAIGTKWVFGNKKDERGIVIKNKARIEEEVYVCQPPGFEDPDHPDKVYKVVKALYGLHQAPRAWYETLAEYLLGNRFHRGKIDQTLFIKRQKEDILLVQVYVDDIIFGSIKKKLCTKFERLMKDKFQISSMGKLNFFLGLKVKQKEDGIFISQDKYALRSMIGSLMYLTTSRPDIMYAVCVCAIFQVTPKVSHLHVVKRIFRYLKGKPKLGLWYPRDSLFRLVAYTDSDYDGASLDRKSTTGGCQFLGSRLISWQCKKQTVVATSTTKVEYVVDASCCRQVKQSSMVGFGEMIQYNLTIGL